MSLSEGAIEKILNNEVVESPIFEILFITCNDQKAAVTLYDGISAYSYCIFHSKLLPRIESKEITISTVIRLDEYVAKTLQNGKIAIIVRNVSVIKNNTSNTDRAPVAPVVASATVPALHINIIPINLLNTSQKGWTIKGQVIMKNAIRTWNNERSSGTFFSFIMMDDTCDIQVTAFNAEVHRLYEIVEVGKTFLLSKGVVKAANARNNAAKSVYEINLNQDSELTEVTSDDQKPKFVYDFVDITNVKVLSGGTSVDVAGVVHEMKPVTTIITKANKEVTKRDVILVDQSGASISLTLWGENTKLVENSDHPVLIIRSAQISEYSGRYLNTVRNSNVRINPIDVPEVQTLSGWYLQTGGQMHFESLSVAGGGSRETKKAVIADLAGLAGQNEDNSDWFMLYCLLVEVEKRNIVYKACQWCYTEADEGYGLYTCPKCMTSTPDFVYRMILNVKLQDASDSVWVTAFHDTVEKLLGKNVAEIGLMSQEEIDLLLTKLVHYDFIIVKVSATKVTYNGVTRLKVIMHDWSTVED